MKFYKIYLIAIFLMPLNISCYDLQKQHDRIKRAFDGVESMGRRFLRKRAFDRVEEAHYIAATKTVFWGSPVFVSSTLEKKPIAYLSALVSSNVLKAGTQEKDSEFFYDILAKNNIKIHNEQVYESVDRCAHAAELRYEREANWAFTPIDKKIEAEKKKRSESITKESTFKPQWANDPKKKWWDTF